MDEHTIHKACPSCRRENAVSLFKNHLKCLTPDCEFELTYTCPICNEDLDTATWTQYKSDPNDIPLESGTCHSCRSQFPTQKIQYIIDNAMVIDHTHKCEFCNGPTIHRSDMNISHRCFFFPKCSGQVDLFGTVTESLVFLDFETTGLDPGRDQIIEVGAIKIDEEGFEHTFQTFVNPGMPVSEHITKITGITTEMVASSPPIQPTLEKLIHFIGSAKIIAHNADFDLVWLLTDLIKHNIAYANNDVICTLKWARQLTEPHCSLSALSKKYAIRHSNAHRALADAVTTKELFFIFDSHRKGRPIQTMNNFTDIATKIVQKFTQKPCPLTPRASMRHKTLPMGSAKPLKTDAIFCPPTKFIHVEGLTLYFPIWTPQTDHYKTPADFSQFVKCMLTTTGKTKQLDLGVTNPITQEPIQIPLSKKTTTNYVAIAEEGMPTTIMNQANILPLLIATEKNPTTGNTFTREHIFTLRVYEETPTTYHIELVPQFLIKLKITPELWKTIKKRGCKNFLHCSFTGDFSNKEFKNLELLTCTFTGQFKHSAFIGCRIQHGAFHNLDLSTTQFEANTSYFETTFTGSTLPDNLKKLIKSHTVKTQKTTTSTTCSIL